MNQFLVCLAIERFALSKNVVVCVTGTSGARRVVRESWSNSTPTEGVARSSLTAGARPGDTRFLGMRCPPQPNVVNVVRVKHGGPFLQVLIAALLLDELAHSLRIIKMFPFQGWGAGQHVAKAH